MANYNSTHTGTEIDNAVDKVNNLHATDVVATNTQTVQANLERIDERIDDVDEALDGKLDASKSAVAAVGGLVIPSTTPTELNFIGVDTDNSQARIAMGDGFEVTGSTSPYIIDVTGIVETRNGAVMSPWVGTQAQYDAITTKSSTTIYFIVG